MTSVFRLTGLIAGAALLSACSTTAIVSTVQRPTAKSVTFEGSQTLAFNKSGSTLTITRGGSTLPALTERAANSNGVFTAFIETGAPVPPEASAYYGVSASGKVEAGTYGWTTNSGAYYRRVSDTTLPTTGSATLTGDYVAVLHDGSDVKGNINGDVTLFANFVDTNVTGTITGRELRSQSDGSEVTATIANVTLSSTSFDKTGAFSGTATGGGYTTAGVSTPVSTSASYEGLLGGTSAAPEAVGGVIIDHTFATSSDNLRETGVFIATR